jgi:hypothetical protein
VVEVEASVEGWEERPTLAAASGGCVRPLRPAEVLDAGALAETPREGDLLRFEGVVVSVRESYYGSSVVLAAEDAAIPFQLEEAVPVAWTLPEPGEAVQIVALVWNEEVGGQNGPRMIDQKGFNWSQWTEEDGAGMSLLVHDPGAIRSIGTLVPAMMDLRTLCAGLGEGPSHLAFPVSVMAFLGSEPSATMGGSTRLLLTDGLEGMGCSMVGYANSPEEGGPDPGMLHMGDVVNATGSISYRESSASYRMDVWSVELVKRGEELRPSLAELAERPYTYEGAAVNVTGLAAMENGRARLVDGGAPAGNRSSIAVVFGAGRGFDVAGGGALDGIPKGWVEGMEVWVVGEVRYDPLAAFYCLEALGWGISG